MNPIQLAEQLHSVYVQYLSTTFDVNRDGQEAELSSAIRNSLDIPGALFNGPFLELTPPYITGKSLQELANDGVISEKLLELPCFAQNNPLPITAPLYAHQQKAIRLISKENQNIVVSSGTGSGKTESFLIPILNDIVANPGQGVRALLVYPMNALVNDQLDRLRTLLRGTDITFGRYTSELEQSLKYARQNLEYEPLPNELIAREQVHSGELIPQILITNYAMLEYLLLRPEDSILFNRGQWRFIVLDEAHTYIGAQGIEVALLLRKLKHRLNREKGEIRCIATSATLTNDDAGKAADFAQALFGEAFTEDNIIFGAVNKNYAPEAVEPFSPEQDVYLKPQFDELLPELREPKGQDIHDLAKRMSQMGLIPAEAQLLAEYYENHAAGFLWEVLQNNTHLVDLRERLFANADNPLRVDETADEIFHQLNLPEQRQQALHHLIELGTIAREFPDKAPLLPARYHLFVRPPQGVWVCLNPECKGRHSSDSASWSRLFSSERERCDMCNCLVFPLAICRNCGQVFAQLKEEDRQFINLPKNLFSEAETRYFTWKEIAENRALSAEESDDELLLQEAENSKEASTGKKFSQSEETICISCGTYAHKCQCDSKVHIKLYRLNEQQTEKGRTREKEIDHLNECPRCRSKAQKDTEIATTLQVGGMTPLSILSYELYRSLPASHKAQISQKPGSGRKLLTFYDSRQGAARFAAFMQDSVNQQTYRHLIPVAIKQYQEKNGHWPDFLRLVDEVVDLAWEYRIFHNDSTLSDVGRNAQHMSNPQRKQLSQEISKQIYAEFTVNRSTRQSLETLGLVSVQYYEAGKAPDFQSLSKKLGLDAKQTEALIAYLLDNLRSAKLAKLPEGVNRDDAIFGRNKFSPVLVRGDAQYMQISWLGKTAKQYRRKLVQKFYASLGLPSTETAVREALLSIWEWLLPSQLLNGQAADGYRLATDNLFFETNSRWYRCNRCLRFNSHGEGMVCSHVHCNGTMEAADVTALMESNYYFQTFARNVIPIRVEEHTAQLDSVLGRRYQEGFRDGDINLLSCSTTFEMGIDLGDLQAVVMSNVPPSVANYRQRSGRAGRRTSGTAFILTWAADRPHDQTYFQAPADIIRGQVRVPYINIENPLIQQRHINSVLLGSFLRYRRDAGHGNLKSLGHFFDAQTIDEAHYSHIPNWLENREHQIAAELEDLAGLLRQEDIDIGVWVEHFLSDMRKANEHYQSVVGYYRNTLLQLGKSLQEAVVAGKEFDANSIKQYQQHLNTTQEEYLVEYLSGRGVLPSYSFPLYSVGMILPPKENTQHLRLERDLRQAIREYAPGSEIVADKRIWRSDGLQFYRDTPKAREYRICEHCNHLEISKDVGIPLEDSNAPCKVCGEVPSPRQRNVFRFVTPDAFRADYRSGQAAGQYVRREDNLMRSALLPGQITEEAAMGSLVRFGYEGDGQLLYVNEGERGQGFKICDTCGKRLYKNDNKCTGYHRGEKCTGKAMNVVALGFVQKTETLHLRFDNAPYVTLPSPVDDSSFWLSLMYALLQGASRALQIERRDISGVLFPRHLGGNIWEQTIVLFDDVPGGAGHVQQIARDFAKVVNETLKILNCVNCSPDSSCYNCLRDYNNQFFHNLLKRGDVLRYLEVLQADLEPEANSLSGATRVLALNKPRLLMQHIDNARHSVSMAVHGIELGRPLGEERNWLELLQDVLRKDVDVNLYMSELPNLDTAIGQSIAHHLQLLINKGLKLRLINTVPEWAIVIDSENKHISRAIKVAQAERFVLSESSGETGLVSTTAPNSIAEVYANLQSIPSQLVKAEELQAPPNIRVLNLRHQYGKTYSEKALFEEVFTKPVQRMKINDGYLLDHERIVNRLGAYIRMASQHHSLQQVDVFTQKVGGHIRGSAHEQNAAIEELKRRYPKTVININRNNAEHDRYIHIWRKDGTEARILIGYGLDFIQADGRIKSTYIVIQDPL